MVLHPYDLGDAEGYPILLNNKTKPILDLMELV